MDYDMESVGPHHAKRLVHPENISTLEMGEVMLDLALIANHQPYKFSTHLTASTSLTLSENF
jgi:hypothetical protein